MLVPCIQCKSPVFVSGQAVASSAVRTTCSACGSTLVIERGGVVRIAEPPADVPAPAPQLVVPPAPIAVPAPQTTPEYAPTDDVPQLTGSNEFFLARQPPVTAALPEFGGVDLEIEPQHVPTPLPFMAHGRPGASRPMTAAQLAPPAAPPPTPAAASPQIWTDPPPVDLPPPLHPAATGVSEPAFDAPPPVPMTPPPVAGASTPAPVRDNAPALMFPRFAGAPVGPAREGATPEPLQVPPMIPPLPAMQSYAEPPAIPTPSAGTYDPDDPPAMVTPIPASTDAVFADAPIEPLPPIPVPTGIDTAHHQVASDWDAPAIADDVAAYDYASDAATSALPPPAHDAPSVHGTWEPSSDTVEEGPHAVAEADIAPQNTSPSANDDDDEFVLPRRKPWPYVAAAAVLVVGGYFVYAGTRHDGASTTATTQNEAPHTDVAHTDSAHADAGVTPTGEPDGQSENAAAPEPNVAPGPPAVAMVQTDSEHAPQASDATPEGERPDAHAAVEPVPPLAKQTPAQTLAAAAQPATSLSHIPPAEVATRETASADTKPTTLDFGAGKSPTEAPVEPQVAAAAAGPSKAAQACYNRGNRLLNQSKVWLAIQELNNCLVIDPSFGRVYRSLGVAYMLLGRERASIQAYEKFVDAEPNHKDVPKVREIIADYYRRRKN